MSGSPGSTPSPPAKMRREDEPPSPKPVGSDGEVGEISARLARLSNSPMHAAHSASTLQHGDESPQGPAGPSRVSQVVVAANAESPSGRKRPRLRRVDRDDSNEDEAVLHDIYFEEEIALSEEKGIHAAAALIENNDNTIAQIKAKGRMSRSMTSVTEDIYVQRATAYSNIETNPVGFSLREQCALALGMNPNSFKALRLRAESYEIIAMRKPYQDPEHSKYLIRALTDMKNAVCALEAKVQETEKRQRQEEAEVAIEVDAVDMQAGNPERLSPVIEEPGGLNGHERESPPASDGETSSGVSAGSTTNSSQPRTPTPQHLEVLEMEENPSPGFFEVLGDKDDKMRF